MMRTVVAALLLSSVCATTAAAQEHRARAPIASELRGEIWGETGFFTSHPPGLDVTTATLVFGAGYRIGPAFALRLVAPLVIHDQRDPGVHQTIVDSGNPFFGAYWVPRSRDVRFELGGGATLPFAPANNAIDSFAFYYARGIHGAVDSWLWAPSALSFVGSVRVENVRPIAGFLLLGAQLDLALIVPVLDAHGDAQLVVQQTIFVAARFLWWLSAGLRVSVVDEPTSGIRCTLPGPACDPVQAALTPYVRIDVDRAFFDLSLTMNLDTPYGFAFDTGQVWGLRLAGGARF